MNSPLVSVICLCYNQEKYVEEAILSVVNQTYKNIQLIVVDDFSLDNSIDVIENCIAQNPSVELLPIQGNLGNCKAFNMGLKMSSGEYVIDLSGDDVLMPDRVEKGVRALESLGKDYGVHFSDAERIDKQGRRLGFHSDKYPHASIPQGDVYSELVSHYFINSATMMIRREVLNQLKGYDEFLAYEDFDFWVRSSRDFKYHYTPEVLVKKRILGSSYGKKQYKKGSPQLSSTFYVCQKALSLNRTKQDQMALKRRILFEAWQTIKLGDFDLTKRYFKLWRKIS